MANKYPYVPSAGPLLKTVSHLRRSFPREVTADTLRKLGVAPKNESYVINVLRFLGIIDDEGKKVDAKAKAFVQHQDEAFAAEFGRLVKEAYEELFELHGDAAWTEDRGRLTQFFRTTDHSSDVVGTRQAGTFSALAALSGYAGMPAPKSSTSARKINQASAKKAAVQEQSADHSKILNATEKVDNTGSQPPVGLTVRIEVNLPASGDQETYDRISKHPEESLEWRMTFSASSASFATHMLSPRVMLR